jgi:hypothetical protein
LFVEVAQLGCRMCQRLTNKWSENQEVEQHQHIAKILPIG